MTAEERPAPAFAPGATVRLRRQPGVTGTVTAIAWRPWPELGIVGARAWGYSTSWGSTYPAHELEADPPQRQPRQPAPQEVE